MRNVRPKAVVTGSAVRVGRAIAVALARSGYDLVLHANRSREAVDQVAREVEALGGRASVETCDISDVRAVSDLAGRLREAHEAIDLVVNNAAAYEHVPFAEVGVEAFDRMMAVNVRAPFFLVQGLLPALRRSDRPCVVNVTDACLRHAYSSGHTFAHYLASKAALEQLTLAWARELGPHVRVNAVAPGPVAIAGETSSAERSELFARTPLGREGSAEDVAEAVVYLARAPYVTGHVLAVDGGLGAS